VTLMSAARTAFLETFEYLNTHLPNPHPVLLPQTEWGHFGPLEQPEVVLHEILARLLGAEAAESLRS
jgi:hypothetical protein